MIFFSGYNFQNLSFGGVQNDYILGPGDEIVLILQGVENKLLEKINNQGFIVFDFMSPILASGLSFGDLENQIKFKVESTLLETEAYVTLSKIREISVTVSR